VSRGSGLRHGCGWRRGTKGDDTSGEFSSEQNTIGGFWACEHRCQYAHFNTGRISPRWTYNLDTSYALIILRRGGEGGSMASESSLGTTMSGRRLRRRRGQRIVLHHQLRVRHFSHALSTGLTPTRLSWTKRLPSIDAQEVLHANGSIRTLDTHTAPP